MDLWRWQRVSDEAKGKWENTGNYYQGNPWEKHEVTFLSYVHSRFIGCSFEEKFHIDDKEYGILFGWAGSRSLTLCSITQGKWEKEIMMFLFHCAPSRESHFVQMLICMHNKQKLIDRVPNLLHITGWIMKKKIYPYFYKYTSAKALLEVNLSDDK